MAKYVHEIMNREVFSVAPDEAVDELGTHILTLGITAVPVIDADGAPAGVISLRDLLHADEGTLAQDIMTSPALVVDQSAEIEAAAQLLCEMGVHRLVVVDGDYKTVGILSAVDLVRGLIGLPAKTPAAFPHFDRTTGVTWTDDTALDLDHVLKESPDGPGVILLIRGGRGVPETIVWAESTRNISSRLIDIVSGPQSPSLQRILDMPNLRFRAARIDDEEKRRETLELVGHPDE
jgi:hypothetical protein